MKEIFNKANVVTTIAVLAATAVTYVNVLAVIDLPNDLKKLHDHLKESSED